MAVVVVRVLSDPVALVAPAGGRGGAWLVAVASVAAVLVLLAGWLRGGAWGGHGGFVARLERSGAGRAGTAGLAGMALVALLAPLIAPGDPHAIVDPVHLARVAPGAEFWFGSDGHSRDVFTRVVHGARVTLSVAALAVVLSVGVGTAVGVVAGFAGGIVDGVLMRLVDVMLAFPRIVLLLLVMAITRDHVYGLSRVYLVVTVLGLTGWMATSRIVRAEVLSLKERDFVRAGRALGLSLGRLLVRHVLPGCTGAILVATTLSVAAAVLLEASLSFLGHGVPEPYPSWGSMVRSGQAELRGAWWISAFPGAFTALTVVASHLLGDGIREALDPGSQARSAGDR
jgi:peptide/nickel transport system permease protein